jgi:hypothetical protein
MGMRLCQRTGRQNIYRYEQYAIVLFGKDYGKFEDDDFTIRFQELEDVGFIVWLFKNIFSDFVKILIYWWL